ncbi:MAG: hypothetical protein ACLQPH_04990, partial [Acidimicrobiales bacterium]
MRRLEDKVSPFLKPMIRGGATTLTVMQRQHLVRWAIKTATVFECDAHPDSPRTPRTVCKRIRVVANPPPGYEVFLTRYIGPR